MNEVIEQDPRYPEWMKAWNARSTEIDQQIIDFWLTTTKQTSEALEEITHRLHTWWEKQHMEKAARREYELVKAEDEAHFKKHLDSRVQQLILDGRIRENPPPAEPAVDEKAPLLADTHLPPQPVGVSAGTKSGDEA